MLSYDPSSVVPPAVFYNEEDFICTASGNKLAKSATLCGSQRIQMMGRSIVHSEAMLRGDLATIKIGRFVSIGHGTNITPPPRALVGTAGERVPMVIGDYTSIGNNCNISCAAIGTCVDIGDNCEIGQRCIIKDFATLLPNSKLGPDAVVPPGAVFGGNPASLVGMHWESQNIVQKRKAIDYYKLFLPQP